MSERTILVWFRNDLRIHDNEILIEAGKKADKIVPVYCFDPRYFRQTSFGTQKTGIIRTKFLLESVRDLKRSLQQSGGDLLVMSGKPEDILPAIAGKYQITEVYHHREVAAGETEISALVEAALWKMQINLKHFIGHTLYHKEDLPFPIKDIPDTFTTFRKKIERESEVRPSFESPRRICVPDNLETGEIPSIEELGFEEVHDNQLFKGGETEGLKAMHEFFWNTDWADDYKNSRNGISAAVSSRLSPWIAMGCLSTREVYWEIKKYENVHGAKAATSSYILEFLWRDYFRFMFKKHGNRLLPASISDDSAPALDEDQQRLFQKWQLSQTGIPLIDACMKELNQTGFLGNKGRQLVASFLVNDLGVNWKYGAAFFEEKLIDYSPASNWGNWALAAGIGSDAREKRCFEVFKQCLLLDPRGDYIRNWIPELSAIPGKQVHQPWNILPPTAYHVPLIEVNYSDEANEIKR